jgi:hypothetical protein
MSNESLHRKYEAIRTDFKEWQAKRKYLLEFILEKLAEKYYMKPATILRIVKKQKPYDK